MIFHSMSVVEEKAAAGEGEEKSLNNKWMDGKKDHEKFTYLYFCES